MFFDLLSRKYRRGYGTAAPTSGLWEKNEYIVNEAPAADGSPQGWLCVAGGTPGTWVAVGSLEDRTSVSTLSAAGTVSLTDNIVQIATGGFNVTLTAPVASAPGNTVKVVNPTASPVTLVAGTGTAVVGNVTLSANASASLESSGTVWYRG